ncbi:MAG: hypothetical protein IMF19_16410, partial [Proteobacteria bacterium]|nr:hypothetical protein [Pseudomonadota bacterium]
IKRFRQSVLAAACSGRLTEDWRREHPDVEPASELLNRIRKERIRRYDEECRKAEAKGRKKPKKPKNIEPQVVDAEGLPELPGGWVWVVFDQIAKAENNAIKAGPFGSSLKKEFYVTKGYKIYGQEQVIRGDSHYGEYYIDEEKYNELITCSVQPGDILISLVGTIGKTLILPSNIEPGIINPRLVKISLDNKIGFNEYIQGYLNSTSAEKFWDQFLLGHNIHYRTIHNKT